MKDLDFKRAFTMVELVFIVIIIGILAAVIIPKSQDNRLREAADQIVSHIRYTQHLAMMDDKFNSTDANWYKKRWQIFFERESGNWVYTIYSDSNTNGNADETEIAINPQNPSNRLTGKAETYATSDMNLGRKYGITGVDGIEFEDCSADDERRIVFDYLGRPMQNNPRNYGAPYDSTNAVLITSTTCKIIVKNNAGQIADITIQPETGFAEVISF
jgi:Tfp pilus assembly protein FimT